MLLPLLKSRQGIQWKSPLGEYGGDEEKFYMGLLLTEKSGTDDVYMENGCFRVDFTSGDELLKYSEGSQDLSTQRTFTLI